MGFASTARMRLTIHLEGNNKLNTVDAGISEDDQFVKWLYFLLIDGARSVGWHVHSAHALAPPADVASVEAACAVRRQAA